jgi:hypothetical protein
VPPVRVIPPFDELEERQPRGSPRHEHLPMQQLGLKRREECLREGVLQGSQVQVIPSLGSRFGLLIRFIHCMGARFGLS